MSQPQHALDFPTVRRASTRTEREAIYRCRYDINLREFGRSLGEPDPERGWVRDEEGESPHTTHLYTGTPEHVTACVRLRHWPAGQVPAADVERLSLDRIPGYETHQVAELACLWVHPSMQGSPLVASLVTASYELLVGEHRSEMVFSLCSPGQVHVYRRFAMRPYGGRLVNAPDGLMIPMVAVTSDAFYYRRVGSHLAPLVEKHYGPGKLSPVDLAPLRQAFSTPGITWEPDAILRATRDALYELQGRCRNRFLGSLTEDEFTELVGDGLLVDIEPGALVTRRGFRELELCVVLDGEFTAEDAEVAWTVGDHIGEESLLAKDGRRRFTVKARSSGRLLVLRGICLKRLLRRRPELKAPLRRLQLVAVPAQGS